MHRELPRILSPNLGCPLILSPEELPARGLPVIVAEEAGSAAGQYSLAARPSFPGAGKEFALNMEEREELTDGILPSVLESVEETRFLISTALHSSVLGEKARFFRYRARPAAAILPEMVRTAGGQPRPTLYDLVLMQDGKEKGVVFHALALRPKNDRLLFIHLTDLHISLRNDLHGENLRENVSFSPGQDPSQIRFNNFNQNLRRFIAYANGLAEKGELDFVLVLGDLVDFLRHGFHGGDDLGENNFRVFRDLILGKGKENVREIPNPGLKVPIFTSTGNHDWRFYPYNIEVSHSVYGIAKELACQLGLFWADEQEEITRKVEEGYNNLLREGSPISNRTWMGKLINWALLRLQRWQVQVLTPLSASALLALLPSIPLVGENMHRALGSYNPLLLSLIALVVVPVVMGIVTGVIKKYVRSRVIDLLAIEAGWQALGDYFLTVNPYFNYAFRVGGNYFLILDTGHDCLRAQYLWDDGDKKLGPLSTRDNTIGASPDSMAFYDINEYYPYSQIGWIERIMKHISREGEEKGEPVRVFIGLHAPPASLSKKERRRAEKETRDPRRGLLMGEGDYDIHFGTINHYLSQFFHLCLGRAERDPGSERYPRVDMVLAGHAHWKLEFRLAWDKGKNGPAIYFGDFTGQRDAFREDFDEFRPFLLQTPACGPRENFSPDPPYFRRIELDARGKIVSAEVLALRPDGTAAPALLPPA